MKRRIFAVSVCLALAGSAFAGWTVQVPESEFTAVAGGTNTNLNALATAGGGVYFMGNLQGTSRTILKVDTNQPAGSRVTLVCTDSDLVAAIATANGVQADPPATAVRFQALGVNSNGKLLAFLDGSGMQSALVAIEPNAPHTINVLCCENASATSPIEGGNGMLVKGNIAYLLCDGGFNNPNGDCIMSVDTSTLVNDGSKPANVVVTEATLTAATGDVAASQAINDMELLSGNQAVAVNSGAGASNDNLILVDLVAGTASLYVNATDIEADIAATDVGYNSITIDGTGRVILFNGFGAGATDDSVLILSNVVAPNADTIADLEPNIAAQLGGTDAFIGADGLVFDSGSGRIVAASDGTGDSGLIYIPASEAAVSDWTLY
jgi:hypothetical protein